MNKYQRELTNDTAKMLYEVWEVPHGIALDMQDAINKAKAFDAALDLIKQKRENAKLQLVALSQDENSKQESMCMLNEEIATYTDCIVTIETEMRRK